MAKGMQPMCLIPALGSAFERPKGLGVGQHGAVCRAEDVLAAPEAVAECLECLLAEWNFTHPPVFLGVLITPSAAWRTTNDHRRSSEGH